MRGFVQRIGLLIAIAFLAMAFTPPNPEEALRAIGRTQGLPIILQRALDPGTDFAPIPAPKPGDWLAVKDARFSGQDRIKGDHRILGDSAFVMEVLAEAEEKFERFYELKSKGYNLDTIAQKVCDIFGIEPEEIYSKSRQKIRAETQGLSCYWAVRERDGLE